MHDFPDAADIDARRRAKLRVFLAECRSRLTPSDVGLPSTARRRVTGLRREEIAELCGVSSDWYRSFESGRSIRVSVPFLARVSDALRLTANEQIGLYHLGFSEIYLAGLRYYGAMQTSQGITWESSLDTAIERAQDQQRFVFLDIFNPG